MRTRLLVMALCLVLSACAARRQGARSVWLHAYVFGAFGGGDTDVRDLCASGAARELSVGSTWATLSVSMVTLGAYTPREVKVLCAPQR